MAHFWSFILTCVLSWKYMLKKCSKDRDVSIFYPSTKFELDRFYNNRVLLSDRNDSSLCSKILKNIIVNFSEDWDVGIFYFPPSFSLIGPLTLEIFYWTWILWKHIHTHTHTQTDTHMHTHRQNVILSPYSI